MRGHVAKLEPVAVTPVRARQAARAAAEALATMQAGPQMIGAARLREPVGDPIS
jgi:hypothetical protein